MARALPLLTLLVVASRAAGWRRNSRAKDLILAISNLNTYNLLFLMLGLLLHWRPRSFLDAVAKSVPATTGVLIQFPLYGGIATMLTAAKGAGRPYGLGRDRARLRQPQHAPALFRSSMGVYSAILGFFVPSGGGKWLIEAPYVHAGGQRAQGPSRLGGA